MIEITHRRVMVSADNPEADCGTADWNDTHVLTGTIPSANLPPFDPADLPDYNNYFSGADSIGNPDEVSNLSAVATLTMVILSWDLPPEALWRTWEVFEGTTAGFTPSPTPILVTNAQVITIPHDSGSGPWYYKVRAKNSRGEYSLFLEVGPVTLPDLASVSLGPGSVFAENMADNAVDLASLVVTGQLAEAKLADLSVSLNKLQDHAVDTVKIAAGAIEADQLSANAVTAGKIDAGAITAREIVSGEIYGRHIQSQEITADHIGAGEIIATSACIGSLDAAKITANAINATVLTASVVAADTAAFGNAIIAKANIGTAQIAEARIADLSAGKITTGYLSANRIKALGDITASGTITGGTIVGAVLKTAPSGQRTEIDTYSGNGAIRFYDVDGTYAEILQASGYTHITGSQGGTYYGSLNLYDSRTSGFCVQVYSGNSLSLSCGFGVNDIIELEGAVEVSGLLTASSNLRVLGNLNVDGKIYPYDNLPALPGGWSSDDGTWIQDNNSTGNRLKISFNTSSYVLQVSNEAGTYRYASAAFTRYAI